MIDYQHSFIATAGNNFKLRYAKIPHGEEHALLKNFHTSPTTQNTTSKSHTNMKEMATNYPSTPMANVLFIWTQLVPRESLKMLK